MGRGGGGQGSPQFFAAGVKKAKFQARTATHVGEGFRCTSSTTCRAHRSGSLVGSGPGADCGGQEGRSTREQAAAQLSLASKCLVAWSLIEWCRPSRGLCQKQRIAEFEWATFSGEITQELMAEVRVTKGNRWTSPRRRHEASQRVWAGRAAVLKRSWMRRSKSCRRKLKRCSSAWWSDRHSSGAPLRYSIRRNN